MTRLLPLPLLGLLFGCASVPPPVCGQREVLALLSERLVQAGRAQRIEAESVNQRPGERPGLVYCAVRVDDALYDIDRFGRAPVPVQSVVQYAVQRRTNGAFLLPELLVGPEVVVGGPPIEVRVEPLQIGVARRSM